MLDDRQAALPMRARVVPAKQGWLWIRQGWQLFRLQPVALTSAMATFMLAMIFVSILLGFVERGLSAMVPVWLAKLIAGFGGACFAAIVPGITAGFMHACKRILAKQPIRADVLLQPFKGERRVARNLLMLGAVQVAALLIVIALSPEVSIELAAGPPRSAAPDAPSGANQTVPGLPPPVAASSGVPGRAGRSVPAEPGASEAALPDPEQVLAEKKRALLVGLVQMLVYLPVTIILWYAPMLVYWHGASASKAMFFSAAAVWRNRSAFIVYGLAWSACLFVAAYVLSMVLAVVGTVIGIGALSIAVLAPFVLILFTWTYCSIYITYTSVFGDPP